MKYSRVILTALFCTAAAIGQGQTPDPAVKPDNTEMNKRDRNSGEATADKQKMNAADQNLTLKIRQSIVSDKSLSSYAHNIKIISQNGTVTLKGPVKSDDEKKIVMAKAVAVTGIADKVTDEVSVTP
jgi:hyperosmotically inducible periplasmic protein